MQISLYLDLSLITVSNVYEHLLCAYCERRTSIHCCSFQVPQAIPHTIHTSKSAETIHMQGVHNMQAGSSFLESGLG